MNHKAIDAGATAFTKIEILLGGPEGCSKHNHP